MERCLPQTSSQCNSWLNARALVCAKCPELNSNENLYALGALYVGMCHHSQITLSWHNGVLSWTHHFKAAVSLTGRWKIAGKFLRYAEFDIRCFVICLKPKVCWMLVLSRIYLGSHTFPFIFDSFTFASSHHTCKIHFGLFKRCVDKRVWMGAADWL